MSDRKTSPSPTVDGLLSAIQERLDMLAQLPNDGFTRKHRKKLTHLRAGVRAVAQKLPAKLEKLGRPKDEHRLLKGAEAYALKAENAGYTWERIAHIVGVTTYRGHRFVILDWARDHAILHGLPWPVVHSKHSKTRDDDASATAQ